MKVGPSESPCRRRLQTAISCFGPKAAVVNVMVKRRDRRSRHVWIREMSENDPPRKHRKQAKTTPKTASELLMTHRNKMKTTPKLGLAWYPRRSIEAT